MARDGVGGVRDTLARGEAARTQVHHFERARHGWPLGYFDALIGQRVPFPGPGPPEGPCEPYTGVLREVSETPRWIRMTFTGIERDHGEEGDE